MEYIVRTNGICKKYRGFSALNGVNMNIKKGSIYGFVGKNGAGKTTMIRLLTGLQNPTSGSFELFGIKNDDKKIRLARKRMGAVVETPALFLNMTAADNLKQQYINLGLPNYDDLDELLKLVGLSDTGRKKVKNFSLGMRQRLGIAVALVGNPDFIILDEPVNGLDPQGIIEIRELILKLNKEQGITILISSHILDELGKLATDYGFIDKGVMVKEMSAEELSAACSKSIRMKVSDTAKLSLIFDRMKIKYTIIDNETADVYTTLKFTQIAEAFLAEGCDIISMEEHDETLESYYMSLLGGEDHV